MQYRLNVPDVAAQIVDGDALVIHFKAGNYFSFNSPGSSVLQLLLEQEQPVASVVATLSEAYALDQEETLRDVTPFLEELVQEGILLATDSAASPHPASLTTRDAPWSAPELTKYSDLSDLLRLDPIHDVDEAGWPIAKAQ